MAIEELKKITLWRLILKCWEYKTEILLLCTFFAGVVKFVDESVISSHESEVLMKDAGVKIFRFIDSTRNVDMKTIENNMIGIQQIRDVVGKQGRDIEQIQQILMTRK